MQSDLVKDHTHTGTTDNNNRGHTHDASHDHDISDGGHSHGIPDTRGSDRGLGFYHPRNGYGGSIENTYSSNSNISVDTKYFSTGTENQSHTHTFTTDGNNSSAIETRPINYTVRIWLRQS